ncbi:ABC transporter permease [Demequina pelophila]|uniref:ABC transporter permease n=1 Tax=Demequina pelophila TaxID=1638984 RepID=UPI0007810487|nr:iron chelate uptake ABC transporter family permease subunit [Demequina pelophila]
MTAPTRTRAAAVAPWAAAAAVVVLGGVSLLVGAATLDLSTLWSDPAQLQVVTVSRIPRTLALILTGAAMAVAGLIMQHLTRNRFVSPSTAGTIEAAGLGLVVALLFFASAPVLAKIGVATVFALAGTALFVGLIQRLRLPDPMMVPLLGIMLGAIFGALAELLAYRANLTQAISVWMNGDFSGVLQGRYETLWLAGAAAVLAYAFARQLTAAGMGEAFATSIGVPYRLILGAGLAITAFTTAVVVTTVGAIPFLGLIVPNVVTLIAGDNLRRTLPATALGGAALVLACDIVGRLIIHPYEVPVGTIVGVLGAGAFLVLVLRKGNRYASA